MILNQLYTWKIIRKDLKILIRHQFSYDIILKNESKLYAQYRLIRIINKYVVVYIYISYKNILIKTLFIMTVIEQLYLLKPQFSTK